MFLMFNQKHVLQSQYYFNYCHSTSDVISPVGYSLSHTRNTINNNNNNKIETKYKCNMISGGGIAIKGKF